MKKLRIIEGLIGGMLICSPLIAFAADQNAAPEPAATAAPAPSPAPAAPAADKANSDKYIEKKLGPFTFSAGPTSEGGFSSQISGGGQTDPKLRVDDKFAYSPYLEYDVNASWNTDPDNQNQASVEIKPGVDSGIFKGDWDFEGAANPDGPAPICKVDANGIQDCSAPPPKAPRPWFDSGFYGDLKYRYGTFQKNNAPVKVNQLLGGGGFYVVPRCKFTENLYVWPRLSVTYFTPITTDTPIDESDLPKGVKADYIQAEVKIGFNVGHLGGGLVNGSYPLKLLATYNGSQPTTGQNKDWEDLWKLQLSATKPDDKSLQPVITYQSGENGGLTYDRQVLFGFLKKLK